MLAIGVCRALLKGDRHNEVVWKSKKGYGHRRGEVGMHHCLGTEPKGNSLGGVSNLEKKNVGNNLTTFTQVCSR